MIKITYFEKKKIFFQWPNGSYFPNMPRNLFSTGLPVSAYIMAIIRSYLLTTRRKFIDYLEMKSHPYVRTVIVIDELFSLLLKMLI